MEDGRQKTEDGVGNRIKERMWMKQGGNENWSGADKDRRIRNFKELEVYKSSFEAAMRIYGFTKSYPAEEQYSLVDQIRRASRSVCLNTCPVK